MLKFVNWLLVFTAGYWSLAMACAFLLFEDLPNCDQGSPPLQPVLPPESEARGEGPPEDFSAVPAEEHAMADEEGQHAMAEEAVSVAE